MTTASTSNTTTGQTILITGATSGIGRHAALHLARRGHRVLATGRRQEALDSLAAEAAGLALHAFRLDVTCTDSVERAMATIHELTDGSGVDALVNNAGYGQMGPVELLDDAVVRAQYETNVFGLLRLTRAVLPAMRRKRAGRIVNVSSVGGRMTFPLMGVYTSTKYAVESLSDALRNEVAPFGIGVSLVEPGPIKTEFADVSVKSTAGFRGDAGAYQAAVDQMEKTQAKFEAQMFPPDSVTSAITHAIESRRPKPRYVAPKRFVGVLWLASVLPTRWTDALMQRLSGTSALKRAANQAPAGGGAAQRSAGGRRAA